MTNLAKIKRLLVHMGEYHGKQLSDPHLKMYAEDYKGHESGHIEKAWAEYRKTSKVFPLPCEILQILNPKPCAKTQAVVAVENIHLAITKFGYNNPQEAQEFMGDLAWSLVEGSGGWRHICENSWSRDKSSKNAQWRDLAIAKIERGEMGLTDQAPALPAGNKVLALVAGTIKGLPSGKS